MDIATTTVPKPRRASVMHNLAEKDNTSVRKADRGSVLLQQAADMDATESIPTIALIAHDNMKSMMRQFVEVHLEMLRCFRLTGTGTTCKMLREVGLETIGSTASGPLGGDQQVGAMIVTGEVDAILFFRDPLSVHPHSVDIDALARLVDCYQVYFGSNYRSASTVLTFMHQNLMRRKHTGHRQSVLKPEGLDLAKAVQAPYLKTRTTALQNAMAN